MGMASAFAGCISHHTIWLQIWMDIIWVMNNTSVFLHCYLSFLDSQLPPTISYAKHIPNLLRLNSSSQPPHSQPSTTL